MGGAAFQVGPNLQCAPHVVNVDVPFHPQDNHIYVVPQLFPSLDAFVITENQQRVTLLQMMVVRSHDLKPSGVNQIIKLFPKDQRSSIKWSLLF